MHVSDVSKRGARNAPSARELTEPLLIRRQRAAVRELARLADERATAEPGIAANYRLRTRQAKSRFENDYQTVIVRFASGKESADREFHEAKRAITAQYESRRKLAEQEWLENRRCLKEQYHSDKDKLKAEHQELRWTLLSVLEATKTSAEKQWDEKRRQIEESLAKVGAIRHEARKFLESCKLYGDYGKGESSLPAKESAQAEAIGRLRDRVKSADREISDLKNLRLPKLFRGERLLWFGLIFWLVSLAPLVWILGLLWGLLVSTVASLALGIGVVLWLYSEAKRQVSEICGPLNLHLASAERLKDLCEEESSKHYHRLIGQSKRNYNKDAREATARFREQWTELRERRRNAHVEATEEYRRQRVECKECRIRDWKQAGEKYRRIRLELQKAYEKDSEEVYDVYDRELRESKSYHSEERRTLLSDWDERVNEIRSAIVNINEESARLFPDWSAAYWQDWSPAKTIPPAIRFGRYEVESPDGTLNGAEDTPVFLPALLGFSETCSLLIKADDDGRARAVEVLQALMLRLLTALPPGKVRFTIIDPIGLGQNFASFMHLADYDESLVTSKIWTESAHIEQQLADLTGHMEKVIQKYLRDQFPTIEDYNAQAGEVAEPYRFLVIANSPVNFSSEAARRLNSIVKAGPRCGVHTLISVDRGQPFPLGSSAEDLETQGTVQLAWNGERFVWEDDDFADFPLHVDSPPAAEFSTHLLGLIGERAREARRVEVPFEFVVPPAERWWTADSRRGIDVPLGRVGATKKQYLKLGEGTAQHALIAGKTGSGKSTLLHALINNLALLYSPDEVELYLVDFKKGVEFKTYATHQLPHARVVAIESEREFGLSVLQRLDAVLKERGERFRAAGAQDLNAYRQANGNAYLPRILLIVDEFQEFFVEDDRLAQEAALLLDRLVRQGRAFGLHVLLGSQTLGGAYSLARSTIDQMAVRIALQCSEADAHLILSEDNSAARLLSRPGEAIYNDANGLVEGNNPFQVVWLPEERREQYLERLQQLARDRGLPAEDGANGRRQIVFEGNAPADVTRNSALNDLLLSRRDSPGARRPPLVAWLGEAIAIKEPTAATFRPQSGSNLLILGQNEEAALGILSVSAVCLAAQRASSPSDETKPSLLVLDGTQADSPHGGLFSRIRDSVGPRMRVTDKRGAVTLIAEIADEVERRQAESGADMPAWFVIVHGLQRFRELRRQDDDFGFSRRSDEKASAAQQFATILRDGASIGVHILVWCDSLNNASRALDRQALREFEMRILFQMSATDSSNLIDTPLAAKLGLHRAFFYSEEQGKLEKFRPYGIPSLSWLDIVKAQLAGHTLTGA
jgi:ABC-type multidrug transport system fused ATPase/permease subunit